MVQIIKDENVIYFDLFNNITKKNVYILYEELSNIMK